MPRLPHCTLQPHFPFIHMVMNNPIDRTSYRLAVRDFLTRAQAAAPARRQEIAQDDIPSIMGQLQYTVNLLKKAGGRQDMCAQGRELLTLLRRNPDLGGDEAALRAYRGVCADKFAAIEKALATFMAAVEKNAMNCLLGEETAREKSRLTPKTILASQVLCGMFAPSFLTLAMVAIKAWMTPDDEQREVSLDWRAFGEALFALPEYSGFRKAVADAVQSLHSCVGELGFCSPPVVCMKDVQAVDGDAKKAWEEYWLPQAAAGVVKEPLKTLLPKTVTACDRTLGDVLMMERYRLEREFVTNPANQYNYYYNPR